MYVIVGVEDVLQDYVRGGRWIRKAAEAGHREAQFVRGVLYDEGQGVPQDNTQAVFWYAKAAEAGYMQAPYNLGFMFESEMGEQQDHVRVLRRLRKAAEAGSAGAQYALGVMYSGGYAQALGLPQDDVRAHSWFNIAATNTTNRLDRDRAVRYRDVLARTMSTQQIAEAQKLAREWKRTRLD